jgi:hypothetical protein
MLLTVSSFSRLPAHFPVARGLHFMASVAVFFQSSPFKFRSFAAPGDYSFDIGQGMS